MLSTYTLTSISTTSFHFILFLIFPIRWTHEWYHLRNHFLLRRHRIQSTILKLIIGTFLFAYTSVASILGGFLDDKITTYFQPNNSPGNLFIGFLFLCIMSFVFLACAFLFRLWMFWYDYKFNEYEVLYRIENYGYENWYTRQRDCCGNHNKIGKLLAVVTFFTGCTLVGLSFFSQTAINILMTGIFVFIACFGWYFVHQISSISDRLYVRPYIEHSLALGLLFFVGGICGFAAQRTNYRGSSPNVTKWLSFVRFQCWFLGVYYLFWNSTRHIVQKSIQFDDDGKKSRRIGSENITLRQAIKTRKGYVFFLKYLVTEYASENLLFVSELVHFYRTYFSDLEQASISYGRAQEFNDVANNLLQICEDIPESHIMRLDPNMLGKKLGLIYDRYIITTASDMVNISSDTRLGLMNVLNLSDSHVEEDKKSLSRDVVAMHIRSRSSRVSNSLSGLFLSATGRSSRHQPHLMLINQLSELTENDETPVGMNMSSCLIGRNGLNIFLALVDAAIETQKLLDPIYCRAQNTKEYEEVVKEVKKLNAARSPRSRRFSLLR